MAIRQYKISGISGKTITSYLDKASQTRSSQVEKPTNQSPDHQLYLIHNCPTFYYPQENLFRVITRNGQTSEDTLAHLRSAFPPRARLSLHELPSRKD